MDHEDERIILLMMQKAAVHFNEKSHGRWQDTLDLINDSLEFIDLPYHPTEDR